MCTDCLPKNPLVAFAPPVFPCNPCEAGDCPHGVTDAGCVNYRGPDLLCIGAGSNDRLDQILQQIDTRLCEGVGESIPIGNTFCLTPVGNVSEFIEKISERFCNLQTAFNTFTTTTFPTSVNTIYATIDGLNHPALSVCEEMGFEDSDTIREILTKLANQVCLIRNTELDLSGVDWAQCFVVNEPPVTLQDGFELVLGQICVLRSQLEVTVPGGALTFDNTGTCLPTPGATDSLESTVIKIRSRLCATPIFNAANIAGGCLTIGAADTLEAVVNKVVSALSDISRNMVRAVNSAQFTLSPIDPANPCAGKQLSLNSTLQDRSVAVNASDLAPGTLSEKLVPGANVTLDATSVQGKLVIAATGGMSGADAFKVKVDPTDNLPGFLGAKLIGVVNSLSVVNTTVDDGKVNIENTINVTELAAALLDVFESDPDLKTRLCQLIASCPSPCAPPTNVEAVAV